MVAIVDPVADAAGALLLAGPAPPFAGDARALHVLLVAAQPRYLAESGVWDLIRARVVPTGFSGASETCDAAMTDLIARERAANVAAIHGAQYETLWAASSQ